MCGYFGNLHGCPAVIELMNQLQIPLPYPVERAYQRRKISGLVINRDQAYTLNEAIWWFALKKEGDTLVPNEKYTSFNARDLTKPLWKGAAKEHRGLVFATEIGEAKGKDRYLMRSTEGFALGCLYRDHTLKNGDIIRSFAVITRPPHERFSKYHEKAFPLFLPMDKSVLADWLDPDVESSPIIEDLLSYPKITTDLEVTKVKSYKNADALGATEILEAD